MSTYYSYSKLLKEIYGEKVYKLPINLPISCPNRQDGNTGCSFCSPKGTGFEAADNQKSVTEQLYLTQKLIQKKYKANKYIAYFQNYTNTFMPLNIFKDVMEEAASFNNVVALSISTRPDCISSDYLDVLQEIHKKKQIGITIELGLQTVNYHVLDEINRGHGLAEFIEAVLTIQKYGFTIGCHLILNLPGDTMRDVIENAKIMSSLKIDIVKLHSLYIAKNTKMAEAYQKGELTLIGREEYINRIITFLQYLSPEIAIERLFSRIPEDDCLFSNWETSWWKLKEILEYKMEESNIKQGELYKENYSGWQNN